MRKFLIVLFLLSLCVTFAEAQSPTVDNIYVRNKFGVGLAKPLVTFDVNGQAFFRLPNTTAGAFCLVRSDLNAISAWDTDNMQIRFDENNFGYQVGIGKAPEYKLDVVGDINITGNYKVNGVNFTGGVSGTGTQNYLTKWSANNTLTQSIAQDDGTSFTITGNVFASNIKTNATSESTKFGIDAGKNEVETSKRYNTFFGFKSNYLSSQVSYNTSIGYEAGYSDANGWENTYLGAYAGYSVGAVSDCNYNVFIGAKSGYYSNNGANSNTFVGIYSGYKNLTGDYNTLLGAGSGQNSTLGDYNTFIGMQAGNGCTGNYNTFLGNGSGSITGGGDYNVFIGNLAGFRESGTGKFILDVYDRSTEVSSRVSALIYGEFNSTVASQQISFNGKVTTNGSLNFGADAQSSDTYIVSISGISAYTTGMQIVFKANTANTGACTINVNSLGAKALKMKHDQDPTDNYIEAGSIVHAIYDGTNFQMLQPAAN